MFEMTHFGWVQLHFPPCSSCKARYILSMDRVIIVTLLQKIYYLTAGGQHVKENHNAFSCVDA